MCNQENGSAHDKMSNRDDATLSDDLSESDDSEPEEEPTSVPFDPQLKDPDSSSDEDESQIHVGPAVGPAAQTSFSLKGGSSSFSSRSHSIFDSLDSVAKLVSPAPGQDNVLDGVFARPPPPPPLISSKAGRPLSGSKAGRPLSRSSGSEKKTGVPDYVAHPERWTHYSLEDVAETSDSQNSAVARQYLAGLRQRNQQEEPSGPRPNPGTNTSGAQQKIIFSRPAQPARERLAHEMKVAGDPERSTSLSHLEEEKDEEEEGVGGARARARRRVDGFKEDGKEKAKERGKGISHLDQEDEEEKEEDEERRATTRSPEAEERKRKWRQQEEEVEEEEEDEERKKQQANPGFVFFRKTNRKKYRRNSGQDD